MSRSIQLQIPKPCHEDWEKMRPEEKGRHCAACEKVVVDFTVMSDTEIFQFFSKNSSSVCGRIGSDQLNRRVAPPLPPKKAPGAKWPWLVAGLLASTYDVVQITKRDAVVGEMMVRTERLEKVCNKVTMGTPVVLREDSAAMADTSLPIEQIGERHEEEVPVAVFGEMVVTPPADSIVEDSLTASRVTVIRSVLDTVKRVIGDSLSMIGIKPGVEARDNAGDGTNVIDGAGTNDITGDGIKDSSVKHVGTDEARHKVNIYPNPVMKGGSLYLQSQNGAGQCRVNLYTISGALVRTWMIMIEDGSTLRTLSMPADMATGIYMVQVVMKNGMYTQKLIVE